MGYCLILAVLPRVRQCFFCRKSK